jgi:hypothetical protein
MQRPGYLYLASDFGAKEVELYRLFRLQRDDAKNYFLTIVKPRLDRSYKMYIAYGGDRQREIKSWQANVQVPYIQSVIETMVPRIVDARPEFSIRGRTQEVQAKTEKLQQYVDYCWEQDKMDPTTEDFVRSTLIYGTGFLQVSWKKDVRTLNFLDTKDITKKKLKWKTEERTFFDGPHCEWVDNYNLWYDWHNTSRESKQFWFKRFVMTEAEIRRKYPGADPERLELAFNAPGGDLIDYAAIRWQTKTTYLYNTKTSASQQLSASGTVYGTDKYYSTQSNTLKMYEVFEWWRPFDDAFSVVVGGSYVPIFKNGAMPNPWDFKEAPFIEATYLKIPGDFEGYGLPLILESPQIYLNLIKNQRLDAATLSIHKMWVVNPLANINKDELVTRPFGIIYSIDPAGVREIQFSDVKPSSYKEEELLKSDMQYASGVDDFSMGVGGGGGSSATEVRHLRESTLERVRMFVNHLGDAYSNVLRYWIDMSRQLAAEKQQIRVIGQDGQELFPLIEKDDFRGLFEYKATVLPSIAGQDDIKKKQDMDLYQLLINLPFIDPQKLTSKVLNDWGWTLDTISQEQESSQDPSQAGAVGPDGQPVPPGGPGAPGAMPPGGAPQPLAAPQLAQALALLRKPGENAPNPGMQNLAAPGNAPSAAPVPPTARDAQYRQGGAPITQQQDLGRGGPGFKVPNISGANRTGKVNTNIPLKRTTTTEDRITNRAFSIQR